MLTKNEAGKIKELVLNLATAQQHQERHAIAYRLLGTEVGILNAKATAELAEASAEFMNYVNSITEQ